MNQAHVLIVEDDTDLREAICETLQQENIPCLQAESGERALDVLRDRSVALVCSDVNMPGINGMELLQTIRADFPATPVVLMTAYGSIEHSVQAMQLGASDYLAKPFSRELILETVRRFVTSVPGERRHSEPVAEDPQSQKLLHMARKVARSDVTVLITGESGTGKEVLARFVHDNSNREHGPFVAINCAAIPENMLEATLFGYEKGAFTGAVTAREGKFEQAQGGTILLDEISEMDVGLQAKILRVLQEKEVERIGGKSIKKLDVRVIATSNRDLKAAVSEGTFREDLYYRLSVLPIQWRPLQQRPADIIPIANRLITSHCRKMGRPAARLHATAERVLLSYPWPGNVRELDNTIQRSLVLQDGPELHASDLGLEEMQELHLAPVFRGEGSGRAESELTAGNPPMDPGILDHDLKKREFQIILSTLRQNRGRRKETAEVLGISGRTLRYKLAQMRDNGIDVENLASV